jgi:hypothetical protein
LQSAITSDRPAAEHHTAAGTAEYCRPAAPPDITATDAAKKGIVLFQNPSSVDIPLKKGSEINLYIPIAAIVPVSIPFSGGYSTEEGF